MQFIVNTQPKDRANIRSNEVAACLIQDAFYSTFGGIFIVFIEIVIIGVLNGKSVV